MDAIDVPVREREREIKEKEKLEWDRTGSNVTFLKSSPFASVKHLTTRCHSQINFQSTS